MSPRTGRPLSDIRKDKGYRIRMTDEEMKRLDYCCNVLGLTKAEIIRQGIDEMYKKAQEEEQK